MMELARADVCDRSLSGEPFDADAIREQTPCARLGATTRRRLCKHLSGVSYPLEFVRARSFEHFALLTRCRRKVLLAVQLASLTKGLRRSGERVCATRHVAGDGNIIPRHDVKAMPEIENARAELVRSGVVA